MRDINSSRPSERERTFHGKTNNAAIEDKENGVALKARSADKINQFFDTAELIVERSGGLLTTCEPVALKLFLLLHLLLDLGVVFWILLSK